MFSKKCCICGSSCKVFKNKKIEMRSYLCSRCEKLCSSFIDPEKYSVDALRSHIELMKREDKIYKEYFEGNKNIPVFPSLTKIESIMFNDSIGMFAVRSNDDDEGRVKDVFRYDEVDSYTRFAQTADNGEGIRVFKSDGLLIKFKYPHYAKNGVRIHMRTRESEHDYVDEVMSRFDRILGRVGDAANGEDGLVLFTHAADSVLAKYDK